VHAGGATCALLLAAGFAVPGGDAALLGCGVLVGAGCLFLGILLWRAFNPLGWLLVWLAVGALGLSGRLFEAAFALSRQRLESVARQVGRGESVEAPSRVACFRFREIRSIEGGVEFTFSKAELPWGARGLYFSFAGERIEASRYYSQSPLGDGWFTWHYGGW